MKRRKKKSSTKAQLNQTKKCPLVKTSYKIISILAFQTKRRSLGILKNYLLQSLRLFQSLKVKVSLLTSVMKKKRSQSPL